MLDELGNLQSEGHGISGFQTMLSIGLGQEQQFTLILQTLQQLRDVYGDSVECDLFSYNFFFIRGKRAV